MAKIISHYNGVYEKSVSQKPTMRTRSPSYADGPRIQRLLRGNWSSSGRATAHIPVKNVVSHDNQYTGLNFELQPLSPNPSQSSNIQKDESRPEINTSGVGSSRMKLLNTKTEINSSGSSNDSITIALDNFEMPKITKNGITYVDKSTETLETDIDSENEDRDNKKRLRVKFEESRLCSVVTVQPKGAKKDRTNRSSKDDLRQEGDEIDFSDKLENENKEDDFLTYCMFVTCNLFGWM